MNTQFKALMHCGRYVDANLLEGGIYTCEKPFIYSAEETIESMIERAERLKDMAGVNFIPEKYFDNLRKCKLVDIYIHTNTLTQERILQIATNHQKQMGSVSKGDIIETIVDAINEALFEQENQ